MRGLRDSQVALAVLAVAALGAASGCDDRAEVWDAAIPSTLETHGLSNAAAILDPEANRVLMLPVDEKLALTPTSLPIRRGFAAAATSPDGSRLLVLGRGVVPRETVEDEGPALTVVTGSPSVHVSHNYALSDPLSGLAVDPESQFAVLYAGANDTSFVQNPNELVIVDLLRGPAADNPFPMTLRSFGGRPQELTFTTTLDLPGGSRRLLVVQTDRDVSLVDLDDLTRPEVTILLTGGPEALVPGGIAVSDGDPESSDDTRIAIRAKDDPNVIVVDLLPLPEGDDSPQTFRAMPNVVYVGGVPSDIEFVMTDGGLRLAALVPTKHTLTLVDPGTGIASQIEVGSPFESMSLITSVVGETAKGSDVALLWSSASPRVAFVALGSTVGKPYKAVEQLELPDPVGQVFDVPAPNEHLKILSSLYGDSLVVLDLLERTASPITSSSSGTRVSVAPDGTRAWLSNGENLAQLDLESLHPMNLLLSHQVHSVFDIARSDGGRALVAIHDVGAVAATVLDANNPTLASAREYVALLLGGLP